MMNAKCFMIFQCLAAWFFIGVIAQNASISEELLDETGIRSNNESSASAAESGPPPEDSHEAMNNRNILLYPKSRRDKRSYEFLMGLINNNSRYEVTKVDPELVTSKPKIQDDKIPAASELLLELMVKIAAHPDHWDKVHKLLQTIDQDLIASRDVVERLNGIRSKSTTSAPTTEEDNLKKESDEQNFQGSFEEQLEWPNFDDEDDDDDDDDDDDHDNDTISSVKFVNSSNSENSINVAKTSENSPSKANKSAYPKMFAYHRVTGKPINTKKNPKAYIAVSIIAHKPDESVSKEEDIALENQLHQLKPWTHKQNLKNMASLRSRWLVKSDDESDSRKDT